MANTTLNPVEIAERVQTASVSGFPSLSGAPSVFTNTVSGTQRLVFGVIVTPTLSGGVALASGVTAEIDRVPATGANVLIARALGPQAPVNGPSPIVLPPGGLFDPLKPVQVLNTQENLAVTLGGAVSGQVASVTVWYWDRE
jgi:hypothetical protein